MLRAASMNEKRTVQNLAITRQSQALITSTQQLIIDIEKQITRNEWLRLEIALYRNRGDIFFNSAAQSQPDCEASSRLQEIPSHHDNQ